PSLHPSLPPSLPSSPPSVLLPLSGGKHKSSFPCRGAQTTRPFLAAKEGGREGGVEGGREAVPEVLRPGGLRGGEATTGARRSRSSTMRTSVGGKQGAGGGREGRGGREHIKGPASTKRLESPCIQGKRKDRGPWKAGGRKRKE
ncbi:hypothetical protein Naga_101536g1, partial [Nannochloropsis gaditana]